ncbi:MAG: hypothetical protein GYA24_01325 [Candidatus Lokiarchaeota archaeon]|nr:hypothetical protein [Candidatus Lokiarchaeota archaeon]
MTREQANGQGPVRPAMRIAIIAMYTGTCVGGAYMLTLIPNIEIFSMLVFMGGILFGKAIGSMNGLLSALMYFLFNILGASPAPLLVVQLVAYTALGLLGGVIRRARIRTAVGTTSQVCFGLIGGAFAFVYTFTADVVFSLVMGINLLAWILQGIIFTILLIACNVITFGLLLPLLLVGIDKHLATAFPNAIHA